MKTDSEGTELKDGDILLSSRSICSVKYILEGDLVSLYKNEITGTYAFEFFKTILRPKFVKQSDS